MFESIKEATENNIIDIESPWYNPKVEPGSWVVSDDGYVVQCLARSRLTNRRHRSGQYTDVLRFPMGTMWVYYDRKGNKHIKNFYASVASSNKSSLGNTSKLGRYMTGRKKLFVNYIADGVDPYHAYIKAYNIHTSSKPAIFIQVNKLLNDELVRGALRKAMEPFLEKVLDRIKEVTGHDNLVDFIADELTLVLTDDKLSAKERKDNIKLMLELFGEQLGIKTPKVGNKSIREVPYEEIVPPQLTE